jgi:hypothetical protein
MSNIDKNWRPAPRETASSDLANRADELRASLRLLDPDLVAARSGSHYLSLGPGRGELHFPLWGKLVILTWPNLTGYSNTDDELPPLIGAILLYYLHTSDGTPVTGKWVSFAELPDGRMYNTAFQGYTGNEIVKAFGLGLETFKSSCEKAGGQSVEVGDASFIFQALPRLPLMVTYWLGDDDFPSSCKILFDSSATHYLPIDGCAILGNMLTRMILKEFNIS